MGMSIGSASGGRRAEMNVVPLIDIVLVLLIIFMVLTPALQRGYDLTIPEKAPPDIVQPPTADQMVVSMTEDGRLLLNKDPIALENLRSKLEELLANRRASEKLVFFQAHDNVFYQEAITVMDLIRTAGGNVGMVTTELAQ